MNSLLGVSRRWLSLIGVLTVTAVAGFIVMAGAGAPVGASEPVLHRVSVHPLISPAGPAAKTQFGCQRRPIDGSTGKARCYTPSQIQKAYGLTPLLADGVTGAGRTIVIIDAFQNPYIRQDLAAFDSAFGLPSAQFSQLAPLGLTPFDINDPNQVSWAEEIALDVQWVHVTAPGAKIVLALAPSNNDGDIVQTTKYVINHNLGDVISQSFGEAERCIDPVLLQREHDLFATATDKGITLFASSGDSGAAQFNCAGTGAIKAASTPASDPNVTGVGGTTLDATQAGVYRGETAWTEPLFGCNPPAVAPTDVNCSGGGYSTIYRRPAYQAAANPMPHARGVPDVAYDAGLNGGVLIHCGVCSVLYAGAPPDAPFFWIFGGTSSGSPQWAGLIATADQLAGKRLGVINPALYAISASSSLYHEAFHDVTTGTNVVTEIGTGFSATSGWDPVTGLGTPNAENLLPLLAGSS